MQLLGVVGVITLLSIIVFIASGVLHRTKNYRKTHINGHFHALLLANALQGIGSVMNFVWVERKGVNQDVVCSAQAGIKQAGNVGTAMIMRQRYFYLGLTFLWALVVLVVLVGPFAIQQPEDGPYFGITGTWCWITAGYSKSRFYLEYFLEFLSAGFCLIIYILLLLRVRGNLRKSNKGRWLLTLRPADWQVIVGRDLLDSSMLKVVKSMVWFPVVYTLLIVPIACARLTEFSGKKVPYAVTIICSTLFNLTGFFNVVLLFWTSKRFPSAETIPTFSTRRLDLTKSVWSTGGLVPFTLKKSSVAEEYKKDMVERLQKAGSRRNSVESTSSSTQLLPGGLRSMEATPVSSPTVPSNPSPPALQPVDSAAGVANQVDTVDSEKL
ncbi:hypothetical protein DL96DRAFT_1712563 [Flagelloscypha sp. PMI_526]|nr:hypothetical protein DL96DRAFT_1712563 [Flagelloscypha sp. PMI_526]